MKYQKAINLLDNTPNQPSKFKTKNWVEINDDSQGVHGIGSLIKFNKTAILRSISCDYSNENISAKRTITVLNTAGAGADPDNRNKKEWLHNWNQQYRYRSC